MTRWLSPVAIVLLASCVPGVDIPVQEGEPVGDAFDGFVAEGTFAGSVEDEMGTVHVLVRRGPTVEMTPPPMTPPPMTPPPSTPPPSTPPPSTPPPSTPPPAPSPAVVELTMARSTVRLPATTLDQTIVIRADRVTVLGTGRSCAPGSHTMITGDLVILGDHATVTNVTVGGTTRIMAEHARVNDACSGETREERD